MIEFHLNGRSGVAPYLQLIHQVRHALRLGLLHEGDQLPKVKDVAARLAINPNTVLKAYRELEYEGLAAARPGVGTFVTGTLDGGSLAAHAPLRRDLQRWLAKARRAGLDDESIEALFASTFRSATDTLAIFAAFQAFVPLWIRPNLFPTSQTTATIAASGANVSLRANPALTLTASIVPGQPGAWIISSEGVNAAGQPVSTIPAACEPAVAATLQNPNLNGPSEANTCMARQGIRVTESYQPASHYWPLQFAETGFYVVLALALAWYCFWRLNRRRS